MRPAKARNLTSLQGNHAGGYRVKKLGASPSSRPLRRPAAAPLLPRPAAVSSQAPRIARVQQECNRPLPPRRRKRRRENANEIPMTPLNTIPLPPSPAHGSHAANTLQICNEQSRLPTRCALARRPAARQQKGAVSRREPRAIGSRRVSHAVPHDRHHAFESPKRLQRKRPIPRLFLQGNHAGGTA